MMHKCTLDDEKIYTYATLLTLPFITAYTLGTSRVIECAWIKANIVLMTTFLLYWILPIAFWMLTVVAAGSWL